MTSHELARKLLELKDLPVSTHANNHTYNSSNDPSWLEMCRIVEETKEEALKNGNHGGARVVIGNYDI